MEKERRKGHAFNTRSRDSVDRRKERGHVRKGKGTKTGDTFGFSKLGFSVYVFGLFGWVTLYSRKDLRSNSCVGSVLGTSTPLN